MEWHKDMQRGGSPMSGWLSCVVRCSVRTQKEPIHFYSWWRQHQLTTPQIFYLFISNKISSYFLNSNLYFVAVTSFHFIH
ncbi:hypothetical protein PHAVU_008G151812 [Phaseolus vulgaris]|uniref:Uncharacterized protein n=1 Tax=Phaseolus vulgaris TaxID=3885 RepID=V7BGK3_PHAVU|nr:hypothetical protein PHAVU_007G121600g [Phaseolus vulgaris]ESW16003.1 hypothetical protein PHAVU_007G121600g [Phaseolus vulgaris]